MNRFGIQWNRREIDGRTYVHVGLYLDSPNRRRAGAYVAAAVAIFAFVALMISFPDVDTAPTIDVVQEVVR